MSKKHPANNGKVVLTAWVEAPWRALWAELDGDDGSQRGAL